MIILYLYLIISLLILLVSITYARRHDGFLIGQTAGITALCFIWPVGLLLLLLLYFTENGNRSGIKSYQQLEQLKITNRTRRGFDA